MKNYKYIKTILILIPILILCYLFNKQFPLNGKLEIVYDFKKPNAFIGNLNPNGRLSNIRKEDDKYYQTIIIDPVYFDLELPANYQKATIQVNYQSKTEPVIELGALAAKDIWNFQIQPIQNSIIDDLENKWNTIKEGETVLLQKEKKYDSIDSFLKDLPPLDEIAIFNYNLPYEYTIYDYQKSDEYWEINQSLKGQHSFYAYLGDGEDMGFTFLLEDLNEHNGKDEGKIEVYRGSELIDKQTVSDDGITDESKQKTDLGEWNINLTDTKPGLYKINLLLTDDILINKIKTKQKLVAFVNKINFYNPENTNNAVNVFSDSTLLKAATNYTSGLRKLKIGEEEMEIKDLNVEYKKEIQNAKDGYNIEIPSANLLVSGDGLFSFGAEHFFNPQIKILNKESALGGTNYIIANYHSPQSVGGWIVGEATFDLAGIYKENNKIKIMISAPNLNRNKGEVKISKIKAILETRPFFTKVRERLSNIFTKK